MTLEELPVGDEGRIVGVSGETADPVGRRLTDLGFIAGTPIKVMRRAPLGDPTVFELRGYQMCLRKAQMRQVSVDPAAS